MTRRILGWLLALVALAAAIYVAVLRPRPVAAARPSRGAIVVEAPGTGSVESRRVVQVGFEVTGRVARLDVDQGDRVELGQPLAAIDDETFRAEVALAVEEVALAQASLARLEADIDRAEAVLDGADSNLARVRSLIEDGVVSREALDDADERHKVAVADLARALAARLEGQQLLTTVKRRLERARSDLARTVVRAPVDGLVLRREREVGDVAVPGASVLRLAATDTVWCSVWVDETYLGSLAVEQPARVVLRSDPGRTLDGRVARIGRETDRETRELLVDVAFRAPPDNLVLGQRVDLWIEQDRADDALRIPVTFLARVGGREGAFVAEGGRARFRALELGRRGREFVEVTGGLTLENVLLSPTAAGGGRLADGERVTPEPGDGDAR